MDFTRNPEGSSGAKVPRRLPRARLRRLGARPWTDVLRRLFRPPHPRSRGDHPQGRGARPFALALSTALALATAACGPAAAPTQARPVWAVQLAWDDHGQAWSESTFADLRRQGITAAELNLEWARLEPAQGRFAYAELDEDLRNASAAGVQLIPIFWESVWSGNPPGWVGSREVTSTGAQGRLPAWWNPQARQAYFDYVTQTIAHIDRRPGFGGAFLDYGWLDAMWGPPPSGSGISGYAPDDVARFHRWLPTQYGSLRRFNAAQGTHFAAWQDVPAALPGQPLFPVYQRFRAWSVLQTYGQLSALVRRETRAPLYYYWGGDFANAGAFFNLPDTFFQLAHRYHATVVLDDAENAGLGLLFGSLARAYGVTLLQEWTPQSAGLAAESAQWLGHTGFGAPDEVGQDFFLYQGGQEYDVGFPPYVKWLPVLARMRGAYPLQPVAVYVSFAPVLHKPDALSGITGSLRDLWANNPTAFTVVTDAELQNHVTSLDRFKAVLPLNGQDDPAIREYAAHGGRVLSSPADLAKYAPPYATFSPSGGVVEAVPTVDAAHRSAWLTVAEVSPQWGFDGTATVHFDGLGLPDGPYHLADAANGAEIPAATVSGGLQVPLHMQPGDFAVWELLPGAGLTAAPQASTSTSSGAAEVLAVAGQAPDGLQFLLVDAQAQGSDGLLSTVTQDGQPAVATRTLRELGTPGAYLYLQMNPASPVHAAGRVQVAVTYLATPGQGFQVQYDGARGAYENGPSVSSPGTGAWVTATVTLPDTRFTEAQNSGADLRLAVRDGAQPLVVREIEITAQ